MRGIVFKIPRFGSLLYEFYRSLKYFAGFKFRLALILLREGYEDLWGGYNENRTEAYCWKKTKANFLAPVYFGCGLINIQKHERGDVPSNIEIRKVRKRWVEITEGELYKINMHCFSKNNFRIRDGSLRLIDYGDKGFEKEQKQIPFTEIIIKWHKELQNQCEVKRLTN